MPMSGTRVFTLSLFWFYLGFSFTGELCNSSPVLCNFLESLSCIPCLEFKECSILHPLRAQLKAELSLAVRKAPGDGDSQSSTGGQRAFERLGHVYQIIYLLKIIYIVYSALAVYRMDRVSHSTSATRDELFTYNNIFKILSSR